MIGSSLYFSGLMHHVDYLCPFPGHDPTSISPLQQGLDVLLTTLGKCFKKDYLADLIVGTKRRPRVTARLRLPARRHSSIN